MDKAKLTKHFDLGICRLIRLCLLVVLAVGGSIPAVLAQAPAATIVGTVTDPSGRPVPKVHIVVKNLQTGTVHATSTSSSGNYSVPFLPPGQYIVHAEHAGFKVWTSLGITLASGDHLRADARLELGSTTQKVSVVAQTPALQTQTSFVSSLINNQEVEDLPLNGRNFTKLIQLQPGAQPGEPNAEGSGTRDDDRRMTSNVSVNGQLGLLNSILIDGMDNNERQLGLWIVKPSEDAISQMTVQTNDYSAEYTRTAGAVINIVTKSGTNNFHGSLYEFFRNDKLDAANFFLNKAHQKKGELRQNDFGGSLGGPIRKDHTFFFGDFEQLNLRNGLTFVSTVPTMAERNGNFFGINPIFDPTTTRPSPTDPSVYIRNEFFGDQIPIKSINLVGQRLVNLYPLPSSPGLSNNFTRSAVETQRDSKGDFRFDDNIGERSSIFARYSVEDTNTLIPAALPDVKIGNLGLVSPGGDNSIKPGPTDQLMQQGQLHLTQTFSPTLIASFDLGYTRFATHYHSIQNTENVSQALGIPNVNVNPETVGMTQIIPSGFQNMGSGGFSPFVIINNTFEVRSDVDYIHSSHNIQFGVTYLPKQFERYSSPSGTGSFHFNANFTNDPSGSVPHSGNSIASLLLGYPSSTSRNVQLSVPFNSTHEFGVYIADNWRTTRWLTLNLGVRWDLYTPLTDRHNQISLVDLAEGKILVAGQNGVSRTANIPTHYGDVAPRVGFAAQLARRLVLRGGFGLSFMPGNSNNASVFRNPPFASIYNVSPSILFPVNTVSEGFPFPEPASVTNPSGTMPDAVALDFKDLYVEQTNLTLGYEFHSGWVWNISYVGSFGHRLPIYWNIDQPMPGPGPLNPRRPYYYEFPNVTGINYIDSIANSSYNALQTTLQHRYHNGLTLMGQYTYSHALSTGPYNVGSGAAAPGPWPQLVNNLQSEYGNSDEDMRHTFSLALDYQLPFAKGLTGIKGVALKGWQVNSIVALRSGLPYSVSNASARANTGGGDMPNRVCTGTLSNPSVAEWFDTSCFVPQPLYQAGNSGRDILHSPSFADWDFSLFKDFPIHEQFHLQFRTEAFNTLNAPNFGTPNASLGATAFGTISSTENNTPREIQFALKLLF